MSYADDQDVWAQVCAEDTAAAAGGTERAGAGRGVGSTTSPVDVEKGQARSEAPAAESGKEVSSRPEGRPEPTAFTGIPEVDQIADEAKRLIGALTDKAKDLRRYQEQRQPTPIEEAVRLLVPLRSRNPEVFDHLTRAAVELVRAYQSAVRNHEKRWANERPRRSERIDLDDSGDDGDA